MLDSAHIVKLSYSADLLNPVKIEIVLCKKFFSQIGAPNSLIQYKTS